MSSGSQPLKDKNHNIIGYIVTDSNNKQTLQDKNHNILGYYDPKSNVTTNRNHNKVGYGNLLATLLK